MHASAVSSSRSRINVTHADFAAPVACDVLQLALFDIMLLIDDGSRCAPSLFTSNSPPCTRIQTFSRFFPLFSFSFCSMGVGTKWSGMNCIAEQASAAPRPTAATLPRTAPLNFSLMHAPDCEHGAALQLLRISPLKGKTMCPAACDEGKRATRVGALA